MSTNYPVLDNRPINKWKVAELKEELKRRNLVTKGLKDDLVRRLHDAINVEIEAAKVEESKDIAHDVDPADGVEDTELEPNPVNLVNDVPEHNQSEVIKGLECDTVSSGGFEDSRPYPTKLVDYVQMPHQSEINDIGADVAKASPVNFLSGIDQNKVLDEVAATAEETKDSVSPFGTNVVNEISSAELVSAGRTIEEKIDKEHIGMSTQDSYAVIGASEPHDVSIQGSSVEDMKISSSEGLLEDNLRRQKSDEEASENNSIKLENEGLKVSPSEGENNSVKLENESLKLSGMGAESYVSNPATQVYEVHHSLGTQVKSDSFSTDTLPINEIKDLNDNLNADNVKLETEVVRQEMEVHSTSNDLSIVGSGHPLDNQMPHEMQGPVVETDYSNSSDVKFSMKNDNADHVSVDVTNLEHGLGSKTLNNSEQIDDQVEKARTIGDVEPNLSSIKVEDTAEEKHGIAASEGDGKDLYKITDAVEGENMEKINLDQSDDSMEEDVAETKHMDLDDVSKEKSNTEEPITGMSEESNVVASGSSVGALQQDVPSENIGSHQQTKDMLPDMSEKRKFQDEVDGSKDRAKRQRRWNTESSKTAEPKNSSIALSANLVHTPAVKPVLGRTNSSAGGDAPKERFVPQSSKTATNSLKIENFVRPFTLKAVQELLGITGKVCSFWMDQIKTHCYVKYSSVEEAIETRNAVYNLQWPPNGGRLLVADFVEPEKVEAKVEGREPATPPSNAGPSVPPAPSSGQTPSARLQGRKEQVESEHPMTRHPPAPSALPTKVSLPPPPPVADRNDPPIVTLDDLFRKTKATPRIYYLPLSDEEVAKKLATRGNTKR